MYDFRLGCLRAALVGLSAVSCIPRIVLGQEVAPYRMTGVEGNITLRYLGDEQTSSGNGVVQPHEKRATFQEELNIFTHGYVYHPNFLKVDVGGGPMQVQNRLDTNAGSNRSDDTLYNFSTRLSFLEQKPYPLVLYYDHLNPTVSLGVIDTVVQKTDKYGANFTLHRPESPVGFHADAFRLRNEGRGFTTSIDDTIEQASFRLYSAMGPDNYSQLSYLWNRQDSISGGLGIPAQPSTSTTGTANLDSRLVWGARQQFRFAGNLSETRQDYIIQDQTYPTRDDWRFAPDLRWQHTDSLSSFYRYNYFASTQGEVDITNQSAAVGLGHYRPAGVTAATDVHGEKNATSGLQLTSYGLGVSAGFRRPLSIGSLQLSYGATYDRKDRAATVAQIAQLNEPVFLPDTLTQVALAQDYVVPGSVVVRDYTGATLVQGAHYTLTPLGTKTLIRRLIVPINDLDKTFSVDYAYDTGGSAVYSILDQHVQASLTLYRYYNLYMRYRDSAQTLVSGTPTLPLNSVRNTSYGARADTPLWYGILVGGEVTYEYDREDISPYDRRDYLAYLQFPLPFLSTLRLSGRRTQVDYLNASQRVELTGYIAQLNSRPWYRTLLTAEASYDEDTGGSLLRQTWSQALMAEWQIRQSTLRAEGRYAREALGGSERDRTMIRMLLRRDFR